MVKNKPTNAKKKQPVTQKKQSKTSIQPAKREIDDKGTRKSKNDKELWARRTDELRLYSVGVRVYKICEQYGISRQAFYDDMKAITDMQPQFDEIHSIKEGYNEVITRAFQSGELKVALDAITAKARINGLVDADTTNVSNTTIINSGNGDAYDQMSDDDVQAEFQRRINIKAGKGVKK